MTIEMLARCVVLLGFAAIASCGPFEETTSGASWPSCSWPAELEPDDSGSTRDRCTAARTLLACALPGGGMAICATNDPTRCEGEVASDTEACHAECTRKEYSVICGGVGPGPTPAPPAGCRLSAPTPGGIAFYCCPCGA